MMTYEALFVSIAFDVFPLVNPLVRAIQIDFSYRLFLLELLNSEE
jgi:hypothetical protein